MSRSAQLRDSRIPETLVLCIDHAASPEDRSAFIERIKRILPHLNWRTHFFIVSEAAPHEMEFVRQIIHALALFLVENRLASFYVHPLVRIGSSARDGNRDGPARWNEKIGSCSCSRPSTATPGREAQTR